MESELALVVDIDALPLTTAERAELGRYEAVIKRGLDTFVEVGNALAAIRDGKLYRATHATFLDYCRERWGLGKSHVYRLMDAAQVVGNLAESSPMGEVSERVIRPMAKLEPEQQREAWQRALEESGGKPTAAHVEKAVAEFAPPRPPKNKPQPWYAPIGQLEAIIHEWLEAQIDTDPDTILAEFEANINKPVNPWRRQVIEECIKRGVEFRPEDMAKAVGNVRHQRDIARKQADARVAYMKPNPKTEPKPDNMKIVDRDLDAYEAQTEREILEPSIHPRPVPDDLLDAGYLVLSDEDGLWRWQHMETGEVGDWWPWEQAVQDARQRIALTPTLPNPPADPRLAKATALRDLLLQAREAAKADYPDLTGRHTDLLPFERAVDALLPHLTRLIDLLEG